MNQIPIMSESGAKTYIDVVDIVKDTNLNCDYLFFRYVEQPQEINVSLYKKYDNYISLEPITAPEMINSVNEILESRKGEFKHGK